MNPAKARRLAERQLYSVQGDAPQPCLELDFVTDRTEDGRQLKLLVVLDEFTSECLAIEVARSFPAKT